MNTWLYSHWQYTLRQKETKRRKRSGLREDLPEKKMFSFGHCPNYLSPLPPSPQFGQLVHLFRTSKTTFYAYDRKNTNDDNDGCNNNYDGNFDDNDDKNYQKNKQI